MKDIDRIEQQKALCDLLGIDATATTSVTVEWEAGHPYVMARWEGMRLLSDDEVVALGKLLGEDV